MVIINPIGAGVTIVTRVFAAGGKGMRNRFLVGAGVALAIGLGSGQASAQWFTMPSNGAWYVGGEGGWTWLNGSTFHASGTFANVVGARSAKENFSGGPAAGARVGYEWGPWRLEEEFAYRINGLDNISASNNIFTSPSGNRTSYAFMTNFIAGTNQWWNLGWAIEPYIGGGVGAVICETAGRLMWSRRLGRVLAYEHLLMQPAAPGLRLRARSSGTRALPASVTTSIRPWRSTSTTAISGRPTRISKWIRQEAAGPTGDRQLEQRDGVIRRQVRCASARRGSARSSGPAARAAQGIPRVLRLGQDSITPEGMQILQQAAAAYRSGAPVQIQATAIPIVRARLGITSGCRNGVPVRSRPLLKAWACRARRCSSVAAARTTTASRPRTGCANRRTAASRSCSRKRGSQRPGPPCPGRLTPPRSARRRFRFVRSAAIAAAFAFDKPALRFAVPCQNQVAHVWFAPAAAFPVQGSRFDSRPRRSDGGPQLADWGAEVIKIEAPPSPGERLGGPRHGPDFQNLHRNKRSLTLDLKAPEGIEIFRKLVRDADVVVENYRPDVKTRLGIDYEALKAINPRLVYASISGFGKAGRIATVPPSIRSRRAWEA